MDRNMLRFTVTSTPGVALRKESVDRNKLVRFQVEWHITSLSARRAWIEIVSYVGTCFFV